MKIYSNILSGIISILILSLAFASCSEDDTLDGSDAVYIELTPGDCTLTLNDTVAISAKVTNVSGKIIDTPISWSVDDPNVVKLLGDTAITCVNGAQGRSTVLRATLVNNKYAIATITVASSVTDGLVALTPMKHSYYETPNDTVWFLVNPACILEESAPEYDFEIEKVYSLSTGAVAEFALPDNPIFIEKDVNNRPNGRIGFVFTAPRMSGIAKVTLRVGEESPKEASAQILVYPNLNLSFYSDLENLPSPSSPGTYTTTMMMDVNATAIVGVSVGVAGMRDEDIKNAYNFFEWQVEGVGLVPIEEETVYVPTHGFLANLKVHSGLNEGVSTVRFVTPDTVLVANITIDNYIKNHPVDDIIIDKDKLEVVAGRVALLDVNVAPSSSYEFHVPQVVSANPEIAEVQPRNEGDGTTVAIRGVKPGSTTLTITALDKTKTVPVVVTDEVAFIDWGQGNPTSISVGETAELSVVVQMTSGLVCTESVDWKSSDPSIATVSAKQGDATIGIITGIGEGSVFVTAECGGKKTSAREIKIVSNSDRVISGNGDLYDNEDGTLYLECFDGDENIAVVVPWHGHNINDCAGQYQSNEGVGCIAYIGDMEYGIKSYNLIMSKMSDGVYAVTGTITLVTDLKLSFNNVVATAQL